MLLRVHIFSIFFTKLNITDNNGEVFSDYDRIHSDTFRSAIKSTYDLSNVRKFYIDITLKIYLVFIVAFFNT